MNVLITGGSSGLGLELSNLLEREGNKVWNFSRETGVDVTRNRSIQDALMEIEPDLKFDVLINCAGINYINWHEDIQEHDWDDVMNANAKAIWLMTKILINTKMISKPSTIVNIVSNASHMPMTNSAAYNASKGAAHILTLQMARELRKRHDITVFGVSPNKMKGTAMSKYIEKRVCDLRGWTPEQAQEYQLAALPAGVETPTFAVAEFIAFLLSTRERHRYLHGTIIPYGA